MDHIIQFLFTDPQTAGAKTAGGKPEVFHYYVQWAIVCGLGLLIPLYYWLEGRKRFFGSNALSKYILDKMMNQLALFAFIGPFIMFGRWALDSSFFSWRIWRYGWALWGVALVVYWLYFFIARYPDMNRAYKRQRTLERYMPQPKPRRKTARAGAR